MKIIEGLKKIKDLSRKADDLVAKIRQHCAIASTSTPEYPDQKKKVSEWIQAHSDVLKEILRLRISIQATNLKTMVPIGLGGVSVTKSIAEWIHRRRDLAHDEFMAWNVLTDRNITEGPTKGPGGDIIEVKIMRFYDPEERDRKREVFESEPNVIDAKLEIINAVTDLI